MDGNGDAERRNANWCERENKTPLLAQNDDTQGLKTA